MSQVDSFRNPLIGVSIDLSSFTASAPADGAIDPTSVQKYMEIEVQTGTVTNPTVMNGDTITINEVSITFTTGGGLTLSGIIATINALTDDHHVIASNSSNKLALTTEPLYETYGINMAGSVTVLNELGFNPPVTTYPNSAGVDSLTDATAKVRGNSRWQTLMKMLNFEATVANVGGVRLTGGGIDSQPTAISFTVGYYDFSQIYTYDELNNNALLKGVPALTRMIARALTTDRFEVRDVINPTVVIAPDNTVGDQILTVEVGALSDNLTDATSVITVTPITLVR